jgi:hypothetical protein
MTQLVMLASTLAGFAAILGAAYLVGRRSGIISVKGDDYLDSQSALRREQKAAAEAPQSKDAVVDRLKNGVGL